MSYKFFQNKECPYFPCHKIGDVAKFNCLMCFCPLYYLKDCGGNFKITNNVKDCSDCTICHTDYDLIIKKIKEQNEKKNG